MIAATGFFTANVLLVRKVGEFLGHDVALMASVRFLIGLGVIGCFYRRQFQPGHLWRRRKLVERGIAGGLGVFLSYVAVVHLGAGLATFINSTYIFWAAFMAAWLFRERHRAITIAGSTAALVGIGLLTGIATSGVAPNAYDLCAIAGALSSAYVAVAIRQLHATEHTATIFGAQCVYGLILFGPFAVERLPHLGSLPPSILGLLLLAGVCAGLGQIAQTSGYRDLPVAEGSLLQMLGPLSTAVGGFACFGERLSGWQWAGGALILAGSASSAWRRTSS
jgi:drug/metabolite transporter (DMT)-like permease